MVVKTAHVLKIAIRLDEFDPQIRIDQEVELLHIYTRVCLPLKTVRMVSMQSVLIIFDILILEGCNLKMQFSSALTNSCEPESTYQNYDICSIQKRRTSQWEIP